MPSGDAIQTGVQDAIPEAQNLKRRRTCGRWLPIGLLSLWLLGSPAPAGAQTVTDQLGRRISVADDPRRVISLAPSITEIVFALEQSRRLKGVTQFSDTPAAARKLPTVGSYVRLDVEKIVALKPDLCLAVKDGNPLNVISKLEDLQIPVYAVDPRNLDAVMATVLEIGRLLDATQRAKAVVADMHTRIKRVKKQVAGAAARPKVFFQIGVNPIVSVGTPTFIHEMIVLAGGQNLAAGTTPYPRFTKEQVIGLAPEIFIITSMARGEVFERVKAGWRRWADLPAVRNERILLVESNLFDRAAPRLVDGLELLAQLIHPDRFAPPSKGARP